MNSDQFDDLKQFISASISQSEVRIRQEITTAVSQSEGRLRQEMANGLQSVRKEMADGFLAVGEAIDKIHEQIETHNAENDRRLTKLEQQIA